MADNKDGSTLRPTDFSLRPMSEQDISSCARIAGLAFESDRQTQFKALSPTDPYDHEAGMKGALEHWITRPSGTVELTVAEEKSTGKLVGWIAWAFRGFHSPEGEAQRQEELEQLAEGVSEERAGGWLARAFRGFHPPKGDARRKELQKLAEENDQAKQMTTNAWPVAEDASSGKSARIRLEKYTSEHLACWMKRLMPLGSKCMYIASIVVDPSYQGRGAGLALIQQGTAQADEEGVCCWVHAREAALRTLQSQGFIEVGQLELDLDSWNSENIPPPDGSKWGRYRFIYMRREAKLT